MTLAFGAALAVGAGGAIGAVLRYQVKRAFATTGLPLGTLAVNVLGSFVLGLVTFAGASSGTLLLVGVGACGSFTTFSSFSFETVRLWEDGFRGRAMANALGNLVGSIAAIGIARFLSGQLV